MSIGAAFALVIFPPACEMTLLVSELTYATRAMREAVEQGGSIPVCRCRAALKSRIAALYFSTTFRDLTTVSLHLNRGLAYLNRGQSYV